MTFPADSSLPPFSLLLILIIYCLTVVEVTLFSGSLQEGSNEVQPSLSLCAPSPRRVPLPEWENLHCIAHTWCFKPRAGPTGPGGTWRNQDEPGGTESRWQEWSRFSDPCCVCLRMSRELKQLQIYISLFVENMQLNDLNLEIKPTLFGRDIFRIRIGKKKKA